MFEPSRGLVAFIDILGFSQLLEHNPASSEPVQRALKVLAGVRDEAAAYITRNLPSSLRRDHGAKILPQLKIVLFADSVIMAWPIPDASTGTGNQLMMGAAHWIYITTITGFVVGHLLQANLPVRGAITAGDFIVDSSQPGTLLFAGRAVAQAHKAASALNLSAVVIEQSLGDDLRKSHAADKPVADFLERFWVPTHLPRKNAVTAAPQSAYALDVLQFPFGPQGETLGHLIGADVRGAVIRSFVANGKDPLTDDARRKADNTEAFFHTLLARRAP